MELKKSTKWLLIFLATIFIGYGGYKLYNYAVEVAIKRIKSSIRESIVDTVNPLKWPGKIFGHKKKPVE